MGVWKGPATVAAGGAGAVTSWSDSFLRELAPALHGWLADPTDEEGQERETGTVLIFAEGPWLKACLHDRASGFRAFVTALTGEELLGAIEQALATGKADWRPPRAETPRSRR